MPSNCLTGIILSPKLKSTIMKNTLFLSLLFSLIIFAGCHDERENTAPEEIPPIQEGMNEIKGTPPEEIKPHPSADSDVYNTEVTSVSDREIEQYVKINRRLESMNIQAGQDSNTEMYRIVTEEGLDMNRYQEIGVALQNDPTLQDKMIKYQNSTKK